MAFISNFLFLEFDTFDPTFFFNTQKGMQELHLPILLQWKQRTN